MCQDKYPVYVCFQNVHCTNCIKDMETIKCVAVGDWQVSSLLLNDLSWHKHIYS
jgi:hypothetical protein